MVSGSVVVKRFYLTGVPLGETTVNVYPRNPGQEICWKIQFDMEDFKGPNFSDSNICFYSMDAEFFVYSNCTDTKEIKTIHVN